MDYIWTFVEPLNEQDSDAFHRQEQCPCSNTNIIWAYEVPSFIGNDCFCDTSSHGPGYGSIHFEYGWCKSVEVLLMQICLM